MVEFEPPKRKALSESELHRVLTELSNTSDGFLQAEVLLSNQAQARQDDSAALANWISEMQALGTPEAQRALAKMVLDVMPPPLVEVEAAEEVQAQIAAEPVFTSEIPVVRSRKASRARQAGVRRFFTSAVGLLVVALANGFIAEWLGLSQIELIVSAVVGLVIASLISVLLKTHALHPLIRSAAVFGGWGVYLGAALVLAGLAVVITASSISTIETNLFEPVVAGYQTELVVAAAMAVLISQLAPRNWSLAMLGTLSFAALGIELVGSSLTLSSWTLEGLNQGAIVWGSLTMGISTAVIWNFGQPHVAIRKGSIFWLLPLGIALSILAAIPAESRFLAISVPAVIFLSLGLTGRDLSKSKLGRLAGMAFLIPVLLMPWIDYLSAPACAILVTVILLVFLDQVFRRTALHIPSLDTSFGFYGAFQPLTFLAILISGALGTAEVQGLMGLNTSLNQHEMALVFGLVVGLVFSLARIFSIRNQDREIRNVEIRNLNLDNLLGL